MNENVEYDNDTSFIVLLTTIGRKTGQNHTVPLRAVKYKNRLYFSRRNTNSDWLKNALINSKVKIICNDKMYHGKAKLENNEWLMKKISKIKYNDNDRSLEHRIILEVILV